MIIYCPNCGQKCELDDEYDGAAVECPQCEKEFVARKPIPLIVCPACQEKVSSMAEACPHCGQPIAPPVSKQSPASILPPQSNRPIRVDTGENVFNRNRGCADLLIYGPLIVVVLLIVFYGCSKMGRM